MKRALRFATASLAVFFVFHDSQAQQTAPTWSPVEILGCTFVDGAGLDELDRVIAAWNRWMDDTGIDTYSAFVLTPQFTAASFPYEVGWLGVWADGEALAGLQQWLTDGAAINEDFMEVIECPLHQAMAITEVRDIGEVAEGDIVPAEFTNCTLEEGRMGPEALAAVSEWADYLAENGSQSGHWLLRPGPGEDPEATYSFKWISAYPSWAAVGRDFEQYFNGGGSSRLNELTGRVFSCDAPRMYNTRNVRAMAEEQ